MQQRAYGNDAGAKPRHEVIERFQGEREVNGLGSGLDGKALKQKRQESPKEACGDAVPGQNVTEENRESAPASATVAAIAAKDALATLKAAAGVGGIVAVKNTVRVERFCLSARGATMTFQREHQKTERIQPGDKERQ